MHAVQEHAAQMSALGVQSSAQRSAEQHGDAWPRPTTTEHEAPRSAHVNGAHVARTQRRQQSRVQGIDGLPAFADNDLGAAGHAHAPPDTQVPQPWSAQGDDDGFPALTDAELADIGIDSTTSHPYAPHTWGHAILETGPAPDYPARHAEPSWQHVQSHPSATEASAEHPRAQQPASAAQSGGREATARRTELLRAFTRPEPVHVPRPGATMRWAADRAPAASTAWADAAADTPRSGGARLC